MKKKEKVNRLDLFLKSINKSVPLDKWEAKTITEEIALYGTLSKKHVKTNALTFWKTFGDQMPLLKVLAQQYLATPSTSVAAESAFSKSAYVGRKERARLSPENLSYTVFLQDKLKSSM